MKTPAAFCLLAALCLGIPALEDDVKSQTNSQDDAKNRLMDFVKNFQKTTSDFFTQQDFEGTFLEFPGDLFAKTNEAYLDNMKVLCASRSNGTTIYNEVEKLLTDLSACFTKSSSDMASIFIPRVELCRGFHNNFHQCIVDLKAKVELCVDRSTVALFDYNLEVFDSIFNFGCENDAEYALPLMQDRLKPNTCLYKVQTISNECLSKTQTSNLVTIANFSKEKLCRKSATWKDCLLENARREKECHDESYNLVSGLALAVYSPCASSSIHIASFMFVTSILTTTVL